MQALDFQVEIGAGGDRGYEVVARAPQGGEATALLRLPGPAQLLGAQLGRLQDALLASSASVRRSLTNEERPVQEFGRALFESLMVDNVRGLLVASRQQAAREGKQLRLVLQVRPSELARLPWEFLFDAGEDDYLCLETPLVRYPSTHEALRGAQALGSLLDGQQRIQLRWPPLPAEDHAAADRVVVVSSSRAIRRRSRARAAADRASQRSPSVA